jgi:hypothetical protein
MDHYILDGHTPVPVDLMTWARWFEESRTEADARITRRVAGDEIGPYFVSTVFLGVNHQYGSGPPLLFETMVFRDGDDVLCWRYSTWAQAEEGHGKIVDGLNSGQSIEEIESAA